MSRSQGGCKYDLERVCRALMTLPRGMLLRERIPVARCSMADVVSDGGAVSKTIESRDPGI